MTRRALVIAAVGLVTLTLLWWWGSREPKEAEAPRGPGAPAGGEALSKRSKRTPQGGRGAPESRPLGAMGARISGRVRLAEGTLPPTRVCARPASLAAADAPSQMIRLAERERCVAATPAGDYQLEGLAPASYVLLARAEGYLAARHPWPPGSGLRVVAGEHLEGVDLVLAIRGVAIRGVVHDLVGGTIGGAWVAESHGGGTLSADDGSFTLWAAPQVSTTVSAYASGYAVDSAQARPPQAALTLWLAPESVLQGRVVSAAGAPLGGLALSFHALRPLGSLAPAAVTADDGRFAVRGLPPGRYKPQVRSAGWCGSAEPSVALGVGETSEELTIVAAACRRIVGWIRVAGSGQPCPGAAVAVADRAGSLVHRAVAESAGEVDLTGLEPGVYTVRIRCPGFVHHSPEPWEVDEAEVDAVVWEVEEGASVRGSVRGPEEQAIPRATVELTGEWGHETVLTDDTGAFAAVVPPGPVTLRPYHPHFARGEEHAVTVEGEGLEGVDLRFPAGSAGMVQGRVEARGGALPPGLTVAARAQDSFAAKVVRVAEDGSYAILGLGRAPHSIVVQRAGALGSPEESGALSAPITVDLSTHDPAEANFFIEGDATAELAGQVVDSAGNPEIDAVVTIRDDLARDHRQRILTEEDGRFAMTALAAATYTIEVVTRDGVALRERGVEPGRALTITRPSTREVCGTVSAGSPELGRFAVASDRGDLEEFSGTSGTSGTGPGARGSAAWCLPQVWAGRRTLTASSPRHGSATATLEIPAQGAVPAVDLRFGGRAELRGQALDEAGVPQAELRIWVLDPAGRLIGRGVRTDASGRFVLAGVPVGELTVIPLPLGPFPGREALLARGQRVTVASEAAVTVVTVVTATP